MLRFWMLITLCGCAQTGGATARVQAGCDVGLALLVTVGGSVEIHDGPRVRRTMVRAEQREDLDRLIFAAGAREWPPCDGAEPRCGLRFVNADGQCRQATRAVVSSGAGQSLVALLGDIVEAELGAGRRTQLRF